MKKSHIYISYTNTGLGHKIPALAIAESIEALYPGKYIITTSNFFEDAGEIKFNRYIEESWNFLLKHPMTTKMIIFIGDIFSKFTPYWMFIFQNKVWKASIEYMKKINPDIVFTTHFFTQTVAIDARKNFNLSFPIITLNPDTFDVFAQWDRRGDLLLVCSDNAILKAKRLGHKNIKKVPNPMREQFNTKLVCNKSRLWQEYNIRPKTFTILVSDGGQGIGKMYSTIKLMLKLGQAINIIAVCGKNKKLYDKLQELNKNLMKNNNLIQLTIFGFISSISPLISLSDVFVGKSGPNTILECLKMNLPVIINFSISPAEKKNAINYKKMGVALICMNPIILYFLLKKIINNPEILINIRKKLEVMDCFDNGSATIAKIIVEYLEQKQQNIAS